MMTSKSTYTMAAELSVAVPLVIAERLTRMALAGPVPAEHHDRELSRMYFEKFRAFTAAWFDMTAAMIRVQQGVASSFFRPFTANTLTDLRDAATDVVNSGLAPVHRVATDNVVRLVRSR
jgi:hypothetical protein